MRVKLKSHITGTRNGAEWPGYGEEIDLPDQEANDMVTAGLAVPVDGADVSAEASIVASDAASAARKALSPTRTMKSGK